MGAEAIGDPRLPQPWGGTNQPSQGSSGGMKRLQDMIGQTPRKTWLYSAKTEDVGWTRSRSFGNLFSIVSATTDGPQKSSQAPSKHTGCIWGMSLMKPFMPGFTGLLRNPKNGGSSSSAPRPNGGCVNPRQDPHPESPIAFPFMIAQLLSSAIHLSAMGRPIS